MNTFLSRRALDGMYQSDTPHPSDSLLRCKITRKFMDQSYLPGEDPFVGDKLNLWRASSLKPIDGDCNHIWALIRHLHPHEFELQHVLDVLAHLAQHPGVKINHAFIVRGCQGSGKNTLYVTILRIIFRISNVRLIGGEALNSRFNYELVDIQILIVDEVIHRDGWLVSNSIKPLITDNTLLAEAKGEKRRIASTPRGMFLLSNDQTPLPIEAGDRRFFIPTFVESKLSHEFFDKLHESLDHEVHMFT